MNWESFLTPGLGVGGLVLLAVLMLMRGDLVTRKQVETLLQVKDQQIAYLERANTDLSSALRKRDDQLTEMMLTSRTTRRVLAALPEATGLNQGGAHVPAEEEA